MTRPIRVITIDVNDPEVIEVAIESLKRSRGGTRKRAEALLAALRKYAQSNVALSE